MENKINVKELELVVDNMFNGFMKNVIESVEKNKVNKLIGTESIN